eukprot:8436609-Pyramimonas_sp.AAC.1
MLYGPVEKGAGIKLSEGKVFVKVVSDSEDGHDRLDSDAGVESCAQKSVNSGLANISDILTTHKELLAERMDTRC